MKKSSKSRLVVGTQSVKVDAANDLAFAQGGGGG